MGRPEDMTVPRGVVSGEKRKKSKKRKRLYLLPILLSNDVILAAQRHPINIENEFNAALEILRIIMKATNNE